MSVELKARCTTCKKVFTMSAAGMDEARQMGCAFSPCCQAVSTVQSATLKQPTLRLGAKKARS
jgi:hypothetical protein